MQHQKEDYLSLLSEHLAEDERIYTELQLKSCSSISNVNDENSVECPNIMNNFSQLSPPSHDISPMPYHLSFEDQNCLKEMLLGWNMTFLYETCLARIGGASLIVGITKIAKRVSELARQQSNDEELLLTEAPENFLDPIMSTLMVDPVILPSSKMNVDRSTIARHLLSDQTDPFNRSHLTMDTVITNTELKNQIDEWIKIKKSKK